LAQNQLTRYVIYSHSFMTAAVSVFTYA